MDMSGRIPLKVRPGYTTHKPAHSQ